MQVIMKGKLIPVFVLAALVSCSQPPVKEQGPRPVKLADVTSLNMVEKSFSGVVSPDRSVRHNGVGISAWLLMVVRSTLRKRFKGY